MSTPPATQPVKTKTPLAKAAKIICIGTGVVLGLGGLLFGYLSTVFKKANRHYSACFRRMRLRNLAMKTKAENLLGCYNENYGFPPINCSWVGNFPVGFDALKNRSIKTFSMLSEKTTAYASKTDQLDNVWKCLLEREPVNIGCSEYFDKQKLKDFFGYQVSGYRSLFEKSKEKELPPNIAAFCKTPIWKKKEKNDFEYSGITLNILNLIGFAFDSKDQVDYKYFLKNGNLTIGKKAELLTKMEEVFDKCFYCAIDKKLTRIVLNLFGCNNFTKFYPGGSNKFTSQIYLPAFYNSLNTWFAKLKKANIFEISLMGNPSDVDFASFKKIVEKNKFTSIKYGLIPKIFETGGALSSKKELDKTLFTNAWDPHSVAGNGNELDPSLDGHWGRISAISVLCDPKINVNFTKSKIKFIEK